MKQVHFSSSRSNAKSRPGGKRVTKGGLFAAKHTPRTLLGGFRKRDMTAVTFQSQRRRKPSRSHSC